MHLIIRNFTTMNKWSTAQKNYFTKQLTDAQKYEKSTAEKICNKNNVTVVHFCRNYKYDFKTSDNVKYEVKHDKTSVLTNNFFIEFLSDGKPSGISISEADFYVIISGSNYYLIKTSDIRNLIDNEEYLRIVNVNITNETKGFLFKPIH